MELSSEMLRHYLEGSGDPVIVPLEKLRGSSAFRDTERNLLLRAGRQVIRTARRMPRDKVTEARVTAITDQADGARFLDDGVTAMEPADTDVWTSPDVFARLAMPASAPCRTSR